MGSSVSKPIPPPPPIPPEPSPDSSKIGEENLTTEAKKLKGQFNRKKTLLTSSASGNTTLG